MVRRSTEPLRTSAAPRHPHERETPQTDRISLRLFLSAQRRIERLTRRNKLATEVVRTGDEHERCAGDPSSSDFGSGPRSYPRNISTDGRTSVFLYTDSPTTLIDADDDGDCLPGLVDSFGQVRLGSVAPEPGPSSQDGGTRLFPPHGAGGAELVTTLSAMAEATPARSSSDSGGSLPAPPVFASTTTDQHGIQRRMQQQHWLHPTRRASPYEYQHEHDEDRSEAEKARREQQKDEIMRKCIAERKERLRRSLVPGLDLTGDCSSEEEDVGMEIDGS